jgi:hypothetical protein
VRDCILAEAGGNELTPLGDTVLALEDQFDATLTAHMPVNVARSLLRLYARG